VCALFRERRLPARKRGDLAWTLEALSADAVRR
jgi:hypothetical protein